jgi:hypothetical protein
MDGRERWRSEHSSVGVLGCTLSENAQSQVRRICRFSGLELRPTPCGCDADALFKRAHFRNKKLPCLANAKDGSKTHVVPPFLSYRNMTSQIITVSNRTRLCPCLLRSGFNKLGYQFTPSIGSLNPCPVYCSSSSRFIVVCAL